MNYPDGCEAPEPLAHGEFSQVGSFIKAKFYELKAKIISEEIIKGKSLIYIDGVGAPQKRS